MLTTARFLPPPDLALHTLRRHAVAIIAWVVAGGGIMWVFGAAYQVQLNSFEGGARAFAATVAATAESMRAFVGPADRLDTYGGYVSFHNLGYAPALVGFWALVQGSKAIRGAEEKGELALWIATGRRRTLVLLDRVLGFLGALVLVVLGIGLLTWFGTIAAGQPQLFPSFTAVFEVGLVAAVFFALALVVSQAVSSSRTSSGIAGAAMLATYLLANVSDDLGWWRWLRYLSPFWYAQQSRPLVPGRGVDLAATMALGAMFLFLMLGAALAFSHRDLGASLFARRNGGVQGPAAFRLRRPWLRTLWTAALAGQRVSLLVWAAGAAAWFAMYVAVTPTIVTYWDSSDLIRRLFAGAPAASLKDQYLSYVVVLTAPLLAAFALVQAARWVRDSEERRTELELVSPVSRTRLWLERILALAAGGVVVIAGCGAGMLWGAQAGDVSLRWEGLLRSGADLLLLTIATGGVGALVVATLRSGAAIGAVGTFLGLSFFLTVFGPMLGWPDWVMRLSVFQAFGAPYVAPVEARDALFMAALALLSVAAAVVVANRRSAAP